MASKNVKNPPHLENCATYELWEKKVELWQAVTDLKPEQQGPALVLALTEKAQDEVLEIPMTDIKGTDGVKKILDKLATIYKKDTVDSAYDAFEEFIYYKRPEEMKMQAYVSEFEKRHSKAKRHGCELSKSILAFFLLNQAQLGSEKKNLIKATIDKLEYEDMKAKLMKVFGSGEKASLSEDIVVKTENIQVAEEEILYGARYGQYVNNRGQSGHTRYNRGMNYNPGYNRGGTRGRFGKGWENPNRGPRRPGTSGSRGFGETRRRPRCDICESVCHLARDCPEKVYYQEEEEYEDEESYDIVLYQSNLITDDDYKTFVAEASISAILDSGASSSVTGKKWLQSYIEGLPDKEQRKVEYRPSNSSFKFGNDKRFKSEHKVLIPAKIGETNVSICTDVVDTEIPLLLSKDAMKHAFTEINFVTDTVKMFGVEQEIEVTSSGHYALPLNSSKTVLKRAETENVKVTLHVESRNESRLKIALKLHSQFGHPPKAKLAKLLERAGRGHDKELLKALETVENQCDICVQFAKPSPRPVVGLTHAEKFNEMVAMDLFFYEGKIVLHMIDHLTRFSVAKVCKSKNPEEIIRMICEGWISVFGPPKKFLSDNGGEFANEKFLQLAEEMNIRVMTTSAESPWSNGLVERHNATLKHTLAKMMADKSPNLQIALQWAVQAKNTLANVHGFSPAQLTFGFNPQLPSVLEDKPPALSEKDLEGMLSEQLLAMRKARESYIQAESAEKIRRALRHNIRPSVNNIFVTGDLVFYKRNDSKKWRGPGKVIGTESSTVLIKHGMHYVKVHVCRVLPAKGTWYDEEGNPRLDGAVGVKSHEQSTQKETEKWPESKHMQEAPVSSEEESEEEAAANTEDERQDEEEEKEATGEQQGGQENQTQEIGTKHKKRVIKKGACVQFEKLDGEVTKGLVKRRTGKCGGKYENFWEVEELPTGILKEYDIKNDWKWWKNVVPQNEPETEIMIAELSVSEDKTNKIEKAKEVELEKWVEESVYEEVPYQGQECLSTTWVITEKIADGGSVMKARLVIRGFEEQEKVRSDSPTCSKENIRILLTIAQAKGWTINSLDVKAAFLQGNQIDRDIYIHAPKEAKSVNAVWKLKKVVYGLTDASRSWYLRVVQVLESLGMTTLNLDKAVFMWKSRAEVQGVMILHVDDILYFGTKQFDQDVVQKFKETFKISREEHEAFKYLGVRFQQTEDKITLRQNEYVDSLKAELIDRQCLKNKENFASEEQRKAFRQGIGQLGWLEGTTQPQLGFTFCQLSTVQSNPQMKDFSRYSKAVKELKSESVAITVPTIDLKTVRIKAYSDASYGNLKDGGSQIGYLVFLCDANGAAVPVSWGSKKAKRVAKSTLTAETLAANEAVDSAYVIKSVVEEVLGGRLPPVDLLVDNKSLHEAAYTTNVLTEKRLLVDMAALRQAVEKNELTIKWVPNGDQLADVLTKQGASKEKLMQVLANASLPNQ